MRIFILLIRKPFINESFVLNELDILNNANIKFLVGNFDKTNSNRRHFRFYRYKDRFIYIRRLPLNFIRRIIFILYYQLKLLFHHPFQYIRLLTFILFHFNFIFIKNFFKLAYIYPVIEKFNPDLFYTRYTKDPFVFAYLASKFFNKKFGIIYFGIFHEASYIKFLNQSLSFLIVKSRYIKEVYLKKYPELISQKIKVLPWGIDIDYFKPQILKSDKSMFTILVISQLSERKGFIYLIHACHILISKKDNLICNIYGYGPERDRLLKYITKYKLHKFIRIKKQIQHSRRFLDLLSSANMFVLPSIIDSKGEVDVIPNACLEAMSMELPVITTRVGGMDEVITDGVNGFFCKENDEVDLADKIKMVMDLPEEKRREIGRRAREVVVEKFDKEKQGKKFVEFLKKQVDRD